MNVQKSHNAPKTGTRPRRSVLYIPGSRPRALEKAKTLDADSLILDLEDAVAPAEKVEARKRVVETIKAGGYGHRELIVRINGLKTPWGTADLAACVGSGADAILVPKVEKAQDLEQIARLVSKKAPRLWAMMETPLGMLNAGEIAAAKAPLECLVIGTNDLINDLNAAETPTRLPVLTALGLCLLAGRAHGLAVLDGVHNMFSDTEGFRHSCLQGKEFGMDGKTLIHPSQIAIANEVFAPSDDEVELARRQLAAFEEAQKKGEGIAVVDGRIVENLHADAARRVIGKAEAIAERAGG